MSNPFPREVYVPDPDPGPRSREYTKRPILSCLNCHTRKKKCNREVPCSNCIKYRNTDHCHYETLSQTITSSLPPPNPTTVSSSSASTSNGFSIRPARLSAQDAVQQTETISSGISAPFHFNHEDSQAGRSSGATPRSTTHKTRVFGQSHWITGIFIIRDLIDALEPLVRDETSRASVLMQRSKSLARTIKKQRAPSWPAQLSSDLPTKAVADELVDCYLRTTETVYRILHIPTFTQDYAAHWAFQGEPNPAFLVQLKLVLAIGATTYDDTFSLRRSAMQWVYEAVTWLSDPGFKHRLNIQYLQNNLLLLLARELVDVGPDLVWISAGTVLRTAIYMGLHKDPSRQQLDMTPLVVEMRRRVWNTILELSLQLSMTSGGPPIISLDMFHTKPPGNFDDEQLTAENPVPMPEDRFTQTYLARLLRKTFPARLAIAKFLNDHGSNGTYKETLRLDDALRASFKKARLPVQTSAGARPSQFELDLVDVVINRYFLSLHVPFFSSSLHDHRYAFTRKVVVDVSLRIWRRAYFSSPPASDGDVSPPPRRDLSRLAACGAGVFRLVATQASCLLATELKAQLREEAAGSGLARPDLARVPAEAKDWSLQCIRAGETSIKGHFLAALIGAQIDALGQGVSEEDFPPFLLGVVVEAEETALAILEDMAAQQQQQAADGGPAEEAQQTPSQLLEDWDFTMPDALFDFGSSTPIDWIFEGMPPEEPPFPS
ncbi:putative C6 transcription factor [Hypoxylon sp. FL1284]|nr:putative C6 transcription factor [Hypoxylon sp. FL1284]